MSYQIDYRDFFKGVHIDKKQIRTVVWFFLCLSLMRTLSSYSLKQWTNWFDEIINRENYDCTYDVHGNFMCKPNCLNGTFSLYGMNSCEPLFNCEDVDFLKMNIDRQINTKTAKAVHVVKWNEYDLTLTESKGSKDEFTKIKPILRQSVRETQIIGRCGNTFIKEYI